MFCVTIAQQYPEYGLGSLLLELLAWDSASGWDGVMIGLRALLVILLAAPFRGLKHPPKSDSVRAHSCFWLRFLFLDLLVYLY